MTERQRESGEGVCMYENSVGLPSTTNPKHVQVGGGGGAGEQDKAVHLSSQATTICC